MAKISREEVLKIAQMSHIELKEHEIDPLVKQLDAVLSYAACVQEIAAQVEIASNKAVNVWREDQVIPTDPEPILAQAPEVQEHYFVVPRILESNQ